MLKERFILGIDEGTTGVRAVLVDMEGQIASRAYKEFPLYYPEPGWVEQDAEEIWDTTQQVVVELLAGMPNAEVGAIGITNQRETTVLWERATSKPIHRAIVWQCRRTAPECQALRERGVSERVAAKTGLLLDPYFSATKIAWILDHASDARFHASALACGTIDTWLIWKLTGGVSHVTDYTNASRTMLFHLEKREWDDELLELFRVPRSILPEVQPSSSVFGVAQGLGFLLDGVPIYGVAGDQQAALYGQICFEMGSAKNTYGTGCFLLMNTGESRPKSKFGLLTTLACDEEGSPAYALEGSVFIAGAAVQWLRDGLQILESARDSEALATSVPDSGGVVFVPALTGLGAPYWNPNVRGAIFGLTRGTRGAHLVRAALEAIAYQTADVVEAMEKDAGVSLSALRVDGGAAANDFLMQFQADILGRTVERPMQTETTVLGASYLAGIQLGAWTPDDLRAVHQIERRFTPQMGIPTREEHRREWRQAIDRLHAA